MFEPKRFFKFKPTLSKQWFPVEKWNQESRSGKRTSIEVLDIYVLVGLISKRNKSYCEPKYFSKNLRYLKRQ